MKKLALSTSLFALALTACTQEPAPVKDLTTERYDLSKAGSQMREDAQPVSAIGGRYYPGMSSNATVSGGSSGSSALTGANTAVAQVEETNDFVAAPAPIAQGEGDFLPKNQIANSVTNASDPEAANESAAVDAIENDRGGLNIIEVQPGQTLNMIAEERKVPIRAIIDANNLTPPYELESGQRIFIPKGEYHEVKQGETLFSISRDYGVDVTSLARLNGISGREPKVGEKLQVPHKNMEDNNFDSPESKISGKLDVSEEEVQPVVSIGSEEQGPPQAIKDDKTAADESTIDLTDKTGKKNAEKAAEKKAGAKPEPEENVKVTFKDDGKFSWPLKGTVIKKFSAKNDGINIAAAEGTKVRATRPGEVVYAGNELKGYGNLVLLKHPDGYLTAYAHMKDIKVKKGDKLGKGSVLGEVGQTGKVKSPQLFFAIRKGKSANDPLKFLK